MTEAFRALVDDPELDPPLDRAALLIAAHARPEIDVEAQLRRLDDLAALVDEQTVDAVTRVLFSELSFTGNSTSYYDPDNSFLDQVLDRRQGIPITLSILTAEVGRRCGVPLDCVGMPGHFLLRHRADREFFIDPFAGGRRLDLAGCEAIFRNLAGPGAPFSPDMLATSDERSTLARLLNNLKAIYRQRGQVGELAWALRLRCAIPGVPVNDHVELAGVLANLGQYGEAARHCELAATRSPANAAKLLSRAELLQARLN